MKKYFEKIYKGSKTEFYKILKHNIINNKKMFIVTANPETLMTAEKNEELKNAVLNEETTIVADGIGIIKGAKILDYKISEVIPGIDLCPQLFEYANEYKKSIFFFGAKQHVLEKLVDKVKKRYPNMKIWGYENGYVEDKEKIFEKIQKLQPDIVLVALGIPEQEILIHTNLAKFNKGIFIGVGGSFDVLSETKKRAPKIFRKLQLEWLYRITTEPKRLKRFFNNNIKYIITLKRSLKK